MAEGGGLLNRCTLSRRTVGSNPIPSASLSLRQYPPRRLRKGFLRFYEEPLAQSVPVCLSNGSFHSNLRTGRVDETLVYY